ncbi:putative RNA-binding S4 domain-containing protein [Firmicutes bacterium CAG:449]|nr:putative RNA-binding S4 domain-containing protein [Firmicutes bacterium CAG:449]
MRLDKFLKVSRLIKRRTIAKSISDLGFVKINDKIAKPSSEVDVGDILELSLGERKVVVKIKNINTITSKKASQEMYEILLDEQI